MDRRFFAVLAISLLFALVVTTIFYQLTARAGRREQARPKTELADLVVAAQPLGVGIQIKPSDIKLVKVPRDRVPSGSFSKIEEVVGRAVVSNILQDEPVLAGRLAERGSGFGLSPVIPPGMRAVAVKVNEVVGVAGFVLPGMRVDVLATVRTPGEGVVRTTTILENIVVAAAGQQIQPDSSGQPVNVPVVTLLVTPAQAEILTLASNEGRVQLVLRNSADQALSRPPGRDIRELYGEVRRASAPAVARKPSPPPAPAAAPPPADEIVVIRGNQRSVERLATGGSE